MAIMSAIFLIGVIVKKILIKCKVIGPPIKKRKNKRISRKHASCETSIGYQFGKLDVFFNNEVLEYIYNDGTTDTK